MYSNCLSLKLDLFQKLKLICVLRLARIFQTRRQTSHFRHLKGIFNTITKYVCTIVQISILLEYYSLTRPNDLRSCPDHSLLLLLFAYCSNIALLFIIKDLLLERREIPLPWQNLFQEVRK